MTTPISFTSLPIEALVIIGSSLKPADGLSLVSTCTTLWNCKPQIEHVFQHRLRLETREYFSKASQLFVTSLAADQSEVEAHIDGLTLGSVSKVQRLVKRTIFRTLIHLPSSDLKLVKPPIPRFFVRYFKSDTLTLIQIIDKVLEATNEESPIFINEAFKELFLAVAKPSLREHPGSTAARLDCAVELARRIPYENHPGETVQAFQQLFNKAFGSYFYGAKMFFSTPQIEFHEAFLILIEQLTLENVHEINRGIKRILFRSLISVNETDLSKIRKALPPFISNYFCGECYPLLHVLNQIAVINRLEDSEKIVALIRLTESLIHQRRHDWALEVSNKLPLAVRELSV